MSKTDLLIRESFILNDTDSDGLLSQTEAVYALRFLGIPYDISMNGEDQDYSKMVTLDEFSKKAKKLLGSSTPKETFINTIKQLDKHNDGSLSLDMTTHLVFTMSDVLSAEDVDYFKKLIDPDHIDTIPMEQMANKIFE